MNEDARKENLRQLIAQRGIDAGLLNLEQVYVLSDAFRARLDQVLNSELLHRHEPIFAHYQKRGVKQPDADK